jgi:hypothetical protein
LKLSCVSGGSAKAAAALSRDTPRISRTRSAQWQPGFERMIREIPQSRRDGRLDSPNNRLN